MTPYRLIRSQKLYYVSLDKWIDYPDGGGRNFEITTSFGRAWYLLKRNPKRGQIDVRWRNPINRNYKPYCMAYWDNRKIKRQKP